VEFAVASEQFALEDLAGLLRTRQAESLNDGCASPKFYPEIK
jgi:hypothetical protein